MRFLADESVEMPVVEALRDAGHDVVAVTETASGIDDETVLLSAAEESRVLVANDKDFGELVFRAGRSVPGVLLLRLSTRDALQKAAHVTRVLPAIEDRLCGNFVVAADRSIRIRPLDFT